MAINADYIRKFAFDSYIKPAVERGEAATSISVREVEANLRKLGLPNGRTPLICSALRGPKFQKQNQILLDHWDGPPSGQSTTVVFHYRFPNRPATSHKTESDGATVLREETSEEWATRLTEKLRGLLKEELAAYGGGDAFLKWMRSEEEEAA